MAVAVRSGSTVVVGAGGVSVAGTPVPVTGTVGATGVAVSVPSVVGSLVTLCVTVMGGVGVSTAVGVWLTGSVITLVPVGATVAVIAGGVTAKVPVTVGTMVAVGVIPTDGVNTVVEIAVNVAARVGTPAVGVLVGAIFGALSDVFSPI